MTLAKHEQVNAAVQEKHKKTEEDLNLSGQPCRIKKGQDVVLNEAGLISLSSSRSPEPMLQGRERADPAGEFNQGSPNLPQEGGAISPTAISESGVLRTGQKERR